MLELGAVSYISVGYKGDYADKSLFFDIKFCAEQIFTQDGIWI